MQDQSRMV